MIHEKEASKASGGLMLSLLIALFLFSILWFIWAARGHLGGQLLLSTLVWVATIVLAIGLTIVNPNQAQVVVLFGTYVGSIKQQGFWWVNPFSVRRTVTLRVRNFESAKLKVNDHTGNPIEVAAVVVWKVVETAEAIFHVDNYENFVKVQTESAVRNLVMSFPYDAHADGEMSLRGNAAEIAEQMKKEIQARLVQAGVEVLEARISHLAYAPEIAGAMLRRQQASAIVAARQKFVEGAVGMVEMALEQLSAKNIVVLDDERKAAMVSNMLVVLCSDQHTQPVINTGTLYQ